MSGDAARLVVRLRDEAKTRLQRRLDEAWVGGDGEQMPREAVDDENLTRPLDAFVRSRHISSP